jgi:alanine racemase
VTGTVAGPDIDGGAASPLADVLSPVQAVIDEEAITHNARELKRWAHPAELCAVVKADGYGHSAPMVARAAIAGGATWLAVALVKEGVALREAGIELPILVLSQPADHLIEPAVANSLALAVYTVEGVRAAATAAGRLGVPARMHVKVDTGMHRVGASPDTVLDVVREVLAHPELDFEGLWTHFAVADQPADGFTGEQVRRFEEMRAALADAGLPEPRMMHTANSAGSLLHPEARLSMVRCGISLYGYMPSPAVRPALVEAFPDRSIDLRPALSWNARVSHVAVQPAGERPSYGRLVELTQDTVVATVPLGYHDGVPRAYLAGGGEVLIGGRRRKLAGAVTMDQIVVDCGPAPAPGAGATSTVQRGDEVVLLGRQGDETITADEWAERLGVINYEVLCGVGPRVPRVAKATIEAGKGVA